MKEKESLALISQVLSEHRARLSNKNSDILWMTGVASALLIARRYRERRVKTFLDEMFHTSWTYMWVFPAVMAMSYLFRFDDNYNVVFLMYIVSLLIGLLIFWR